MSVLVVGNGGREHALAWAIRKNARVARLAVAPGNAGTAEIAENLPVAPTDVAGMVQAARAWKADFVVVGPDAALGAGMVDALEAEGIPVFGPTRAAAQIETSKRFAKEVMAAAEVPTARWRTFADLEEARRYVRQVGAPLVVKADGLAAGKGVAVCETLEEVERALVDNLERRVFGAASQSVVIEEKLTGREVSLFALVDGKRAVPLAAACDYKRVGEGDTGPNTGGMGAYTPPEFFTSFDIATVMETIVQPVVDELCRRGTPFRGTLYAGLMVTDSGPKVLEFNARFGDPETEAIVPCLDVDLFDLLYATATEGLAGIRFPPSTKAAVSVALAAERYPGTPVVGDEITIGPLPAGVVVFHAGTRRVDSRLVTDGGRVLHVVGTGGSVAAARERAYEGVQAIQFRGMHYRRDIALGG
ncbi:MAG: phosphoribosylamine--glycine ligase [Chloroflexota bacterium]|nr:phosphoribosylamine--glycine ligase [Dehalococcoidia bacterium]MDW8253343.1 phosphoribosylamine--glycine ligase [Chloroflexota bacterium]